MYFRRQHLSISTGVKREPLKTLHKEINIERKFRKQKKQQPISKVSQLHSWPLVPFRLLN